MSGDLLDRRGYYARPGGDVNPNLDGTVPTYRVPMKPSMASPSISTGAPRTPGLAVRLGARVLVLVVLLFGVAACAGSAATQSPRPTVDPAGTWLRAVTSRAVPPANRFAIGPTAVITADGTYVTAARTDASGTGSLLPDLVARSISDAGRDAIVGEAGRLGLLGGKTDFRGVGAMPGSAIGRLQLTVDGARVTFIGEPDAQLLCIAAPCDPLPGTPEAFGELWRMLADPAAWLGADLGPEAPFVAESYAVLVGPAGAADQAEGVQEWPLDTTLATFGDPVGNGALRCGIVAGADADTLRPALETATRQTQWVEGASTNDFFSLVVRPIVSGEDPCGETIGGG